MKMVTEDLVNSKEDGVSAEEAIDVKEKKKKRTLTWALATLKEEDTDREKKSIFYLLKKMNKEQDIPVEQW